MMEHSQYLIGKEEYEVCQKIKDDFDRTKRISDKLKTLSTSLEERSNMAVSLSSSMKDSIINRENK